MLVLSRKPGERILVGENIVLTIVRITPNNVRIGIEAPRGTNILREELTCTCDSGGECPACKRQREGE